MCSPQIRKVQAIAGSMVSHTGEGSRIFRFYSKRDPTLTNILFRFTHLEGIILFLDKKIFASGVSFVPSNKANIQP